MSLRPIIQIQSLKKVYTSADQESFEVKALDGIDLTIQAGEFVAIMGPSGSGKSTLMQILGLLDTASSGVYLLDGEDVAGLDEDRLASIRSQKMGFIFQFFNLLPRTSCIDNVALPLLYAGDPAPTDRAIELLKVMGMDGRLFHKPHQLSGGQQQRVAIARALANRPKIIFADEPTGNVSTQQTEEILNYLEQLNLAGTTIILITHEPEVANRARRLITIRDGVLFKDEQLRERVAATAPTLAIDKPTDSVPASAPTVSKFSGRLFENFKMARIALTLNKLRTSLATLGVVIGIASFVAMLAIGQGAQRAVEEQISQFGTNILHIKAISGQGSKGLAGESFRKFNTNDLTAIQSWAQGQPSIKAVDGQVYGNATVARNSANSLSELVGSTPLLSEMQNYTTLSGRFFTSEENSARARVAVVGQTVARNLFGPNVNPVGSVIKINRVDYDVIGLLNEKGSTGTRDRDDIVVVPLNTAMSRILGRDSLSIISVEARTPQLLEQAQSQMISFLRLLRSESPDQPDNFEVRNMNEVKELYTHTTGIISSMLQAIAAVALLVGGIGIMNVMFVSVKERTREVGLRKAIGAKKSDILVQFLIESVMIGLLGGVFGCILGFAMCQFAEGILGWQAKMSMQAVTVSFGFSALVGIVFGLWPAKQASNLSPIEALRFE